MTFRTAGGRLNVYHDSLKKAGSQSSLVKIKSARLAEKEEKIVIEFKDSKIYASASNIGSVIKAISEY